MNDSSDWDPSSLGRQLRSHDIKDNFAFDPALLSNPPSTSADLPQRQQHPSPSDTPLPNVHSPPTSQPFLTTNLLPPLPFDHPSTSPTSAVPHPTSLPTLPTTTAAPSSNPPVTGAPLIIQFDPRESQTDDEDDDDDDDASGGQGRPKKRKSVANLRAANAAGAAASRGGDDEDDKDKGRRKIQIEYIEEKSKRHITFSKRKAGIMKKAYELSTLTGTQVLLLVVSESGWVYTFTTDKFKPLVKEDEHGGLSQGQKLIASCLESKENVSHAPNGYHPQQATAPVGNFEANSAIHGGQIALKTNQRGPPRPMNSNRRVSSRGRNHIPTAIRTDSGAPPVPQLPTPLSGGYLDPTLQSPISPRDRKPGIPPMSPASMGHMQQQQRQQHQQQQMQMPGSAGGNQDYADMLQRADMLHMQGYDSSPIGYGDPNMRYHSPPPSAGHPHMTMMPQHGDNRYQQQPHPHDQYQQRMYGNDIYGNDHHYSNHQQPYHHTIDDGGDPYR